MSRTRLTLLIILLLTAVATSWLRTQTDTVQQQQTINQPRQVDLFLQNFRINRFSETGQLHYSIQGQRLEYYTDRNASKITSPEMQLVDFDNQPRWQINASQAETNPDHFDQITFSGNVKLQQFTSNTRLETTELLLETDIEQITANDTIIINDDHTKIVAASLDANLNTGILNLTKVTALYAP